MEGLRLGLFDTAVLSLPFLAPCDCRSAADFLSMYVSNTMSGRREPNPVRAQLIYSFFSKHTNRAKEMVLKVLVPAPKGGDEDEDKDSDDEKEKEKKPAGVRAQQEACIVLPIAAAQPVMV